MLAAAPAELFIRAGAAASIIGGALLIAVLSVGLLVAILQAATQVQEQTLGFLCKLLAIGVMLYFLGPEFAMLLQQLMVEYLQEAAAAAAAGG